MESQKLSPGKFAKNYGIILGLILIVISVIMYVTGMQLEGKQWPMYIFYIIFPVVVIYAINQFKKEQGNLLTIGESIKVGLVVAVVSALVFAVYNLLFNYVIDSEFTQQVMQAEMDRQLESGALTEEMIEQSASIREIFTNPFVGSTIFIALSAIFGLIYSLIGGLIMKREE
jgi:membrane protease YdiL (CAAX protease family)